MKSIIGSMVATAGLMAAVCASAEEMPALAKKLNCTACHAIDKKVVGPAWRDVAKKYTGSGVTKYTYNGKEYPLIEGLVHEGIPRRLGQLGDHADAGERSERRQTGGDHRTGQVRAELGHQVSGSIRQQMPAQAGFFCCELPVKLTSSAPAPHNPCHSSRD